ncbi:hypothetical protein M3Y97_00507700 [Aphelenchoides bicaudatus]|nr:hypothetical protein M3Y97_00507700 [Aphelenchoides bicaudatus]
MRYITICLLLFTCVLAQKTGESAEKLVVDSDTNSKDAEWSNMELIPRDQLCLLCHSVITKFQQASNKNPEQFKNDLLTSCALLKEPVEIKKCRDGITDDQLSKLNSTSVSDICVAQKLCKDGETVDLSQSNSKTSSEQNDDQFEAIPDVEGAAATHTQDPKGFKMFEKSQDSIQGAYAK